MIMSSKSQDLCRTINVHRDLTGHNSQNVSPYSLLSDLAVRDHWEDPSIKSLAQNIEKKGKKRIFDIQQSGFAGGHPPNY